MIFCAVFLSDETETVFSFFSLITLDFVRTIVDEFIIRHRDTVLVNLHQPSYPSVILPVHKGIIFIYFCRFFFQLLSSLLSSFLFAFSPRPVADCHKLRVSQWNLVVLINPVTHHRERRVRGNGRSWGGLIQEWVEWAFRKSAIPRRRWTSSLSSSLLSSSSSFILFCTFTALSIYLYHCVLGRSPNLGERVAVRLLYGNATRRVYTAKTRISRNSVTISFVCFFFLSPQMRRVRRRARRRSLSQL